MSPLKKSVMSHTCEAGTITIKVTHGGASDVGDGINCVMMNVDLYLVVSHRL